MAHRGGVAATDRTTGGALTQVHPGSAHPQAFLTARGRGRGLTLVSHRVIAVTRSAHGDVSLTLQGDANDAPDEKPDRPEQVQGAVVYAVPYFGWVANRLNVGAGAKYGAWAAYALIAIGCLRILLGLVGSGARRARRTHARDRAMGTELPAQGATSSR
ncbi:MAG: signal peptidase [Nocardioides sp.]|nr:signal peptidase [Nocardioides sp.]